jgi:hypothetical protein
MSNKIQSVLTLDGLNARVELPQGFPSIDKAITIEFWAKGENTLAQQTSVCEAENAQKARVLNVHLPWKHTADTRIFWDAGNENGFDRIDKAVQLQDYNVWTHWAFVKDATTGKMYIYRNGQIWHQGDGKKKSLAGIGKLTIGSLCNATNYWKGSLTEFRIWNKPRTQAEIQQHMHRRLVGNEPGLCDYLPLKGDGNNQANSGNNCTIHGGTWKQEELPLTDKVGKIVVNSDEWTLSNSGFAKAPDAGTFVTNIAKWFTGGRSTGKFHAYSTNFGLTESSLAETMTKAGYTWTVGTNIKFDLPTLLTFDGIFVVADLAADNQVLIDYVKAGGNVYICAGTGRAGGGAQEDANRWNTFLNAFGLKFAGTYGGIVGNQTVNSSHPLFAGVKAIFQARW